jgi:subtilase family serine protease
MDIEAVHSVAPGAGIALVYIPSAFDLMDGIDYVASHHLANVISNSWTYDCSGTVCPDTQLGMAFVNSEDVRLATDVAQGVTIVFASGDSGSNPGSLGTEFPSSDPNVLAAGATNLALAGCGVTTCTGYGSESGAIISGGGYSGFFSEPS